MLQMESITMIDTDFDLSEIDGHIYGAGIVPCAFNDDGKMCFLLGKERFIQHWKGSLQWSGFEGGRKENETVEQTAAREFVEESMGVVPVGADGQYRTRLAIAGMLERKEYCCKLVLCIKQRTQHSARRHPRYHVTYLVETPFSADMPHEFATERLNFVRVQDEVHSMTRFKRYLNQRSMLCEGVRTMDGMVVDELLSVKETDSWYTLAYRTSKGNQTAILHKSCRNMVYFEWFRAKRHVMDGLCYMRSKLSLFVNDTSIPKSSDFHRIQFNNDVIEKICIQWWCVDDLVHMLQNEGCHGRERLRPYFMPVADRLVREMRSCASAHVPRIDGLG